MIPSSRSMLSRDKRLPLDTWNTSGLQENAFANQFSTFDSARDRHQRIHSCAPQRERGSVPQAAGSETPFTRDDKQNQGTIPMPTFATRPFTTRSTVPMNFCRIPWLDRKDSKYGNRKSTGSLIHNRSWCGKQDSKHSFQVVLIFRRKLCYGRKKWCEWNCDDAWLSGMYEWLLRKRSDTWATGMMANSPLKSLSGSRLLVHIPEQLNSCQDWHNTQTGMTTGSLQRQNIGYGHEYLTSGDGWFFGRTKILAIGFWKEFSKFWDAWREDCLGSEQDHLDGNLWYLSLTGTIGWTIAPKKRVCNFIHPSSIVPFLNVWNSHIPTKRHYQVMRERSPSYEMVLLRAWKQTSTLFWNDTRSTFERPSQNSAKHLPEDTTHLLKSCSLRQQCA